MCIGCNGAAALSVCSAFLANQLRECAISPDSAIGTIGPPGKNGTLHGLGEVCPPPCCPLLSVARVISPTISPGAAWMAADRVEPVAGAPMPGFDSSEACPKARVARPVGAVAQAELTNPHRRSTRWPVASLRRPRFYAWSRVLQRSIPASAPANFPSNIRDLDAPLRATLGGPQGSDSFSKCQDRSQHMLVWTNPFT